MNAWLWARHISRVFCSTCSRGVLLVKWHALLCIGCHAWPATGLPHRSASQGACICRSVFCLFAALPLAPALTALSCSCALLKCDLLHTQTHTPQESSQPSAEPAGKRQRHTQSHMLRRQQQWLRRGRHGEPAAAAEAGLQQLESWGRTRRCGAETVPAAGFGGTQGSRTAPPPVRAGGQAEQGRCCQWVYGCQGQRKRRPRRSRADASSGPRLQNRQHAGAAASWRPSPSCSSLPPTVAQRVGCLAPAQSSPPSLPLSHCLQPSKPSRSFVLCWSPPKQGVWRGCCWGSSPSLPITLHCSRRLAAAALAPTCVRSVDGPARFAMLLRALVLQERLFRGKHCSQMHPPIHNRVATLSPGLPLAERPKEAWLRHIATAAAAAAAAGAAAEAAGKPGRLH